MNRREILRYTAYATGAAVCAPIASSILSGCQNKAANKPLNTLHFFSNAEYQFISRVVDIILPKTDSPAATDVGVHEMIDLMVGQVFTVNDQANYRKKFDQLYLEHSKSKNLKDEITQLDKRSNGDDISDAYLTLKQQTIAYYLTSEEVGKNHLNYLPVPGEYEACIDINENTKAWAI